MRRADFLRLSAAAAAVPWLAGCSSERERFAALSVGAMDQGQAAAFAHAGYGHLELSVSADLVPDQDDAAFAPRLERLRRLEPSCRMMNGFYHAERKMVGPDADHAFFLRWGAIAFPRAAQAGVRIITIGSGKARRCPDGFEIGRAREQFAKLLAGLLPMAADQGIALAIENLNERETNLGVTMDESLGIVTAAGEGMQLTCDLYHMMRMSESPSALTRALSRVVHCHVAEREGRTPPGTAGDDFRPFLRVLREGGYPGAFSFECGWGAGKATPTVALAAFREQLRSC